MTERHNMFLSRENDFYFANITQDPINVGQ